jgi:rSAM/selenodomain-associated transferase 1
MTKAPQAGTVKTRLVPPLSHEEAAELHACFLRDTAANIAQVTAQGSSDAFAIYTPAGTEWLLADLVPRSCRLLLQRGSGFGERLFHAAVDLFALGYGGVCLIDSDSPTLPASVLSRAVALLSRSSNRLVLGPADDGGYYLIGLTAPHRSLFSDIAWSTDKVLTQTIDRAEDLRLEIELLPSWYDVDDESSLGRLYRELCQNGHSPSPPAGYRAPHTRHYLSRLMEPRQSPIPQPPAVSRPWR